MLLTSKDIPTLKLLFQQCFIEKGDNLLRLIFTVLKMKLYRNDEMEPRSIWVPTQLRGKKTGKMLTNLIH